VTAIHRPRDNANRPTTEEHAMPKLYADSTARRTRQIVADVFVLCWIALCAWIGRTVAAGIESLRGPVDNLTSAGDSIRDNMSGAANNVGGVPLVGDSLRGPFDGIFNAGQTMANAGTSFGVTVDQAARIIGILVAVVPIFVVVVVWAWFRIRFVRRATTAQRWLGRPGPVELFALRALTHQPLGSLEQVGPDPAGRFRSGDRAALRALADL
jgi:hypothetical protein